MNKGCGVPIDLGSLIIMTGDDIDMTMLSDLFQEDEDFKLLEDDKDPTKWWEIYAYQTTRTREAKR